MKVRKKLQKLINDQGYVKQLSVPLYKEALRDAISIGGSTASMYMTDTDYVTPFSDTIGLVVSKQVDADNYPKNKKFRLKPREVGESFLTDACYAVTKFTLDEALKQSYGVKCAVPWNRNKSFMHHACALFVEGTVRHFAKQFIHACLIKPVVNTIFGEPVTKTKKVKRVAELAIAEKYSQQRA